VMGTARLRRAAEGLRSIAALGLPMSQQRTALCDA